MSAIGGRADIEQLYQVVEEGWAAYRARSRQPGRDFDMLHTNLHSCSFGLRGRRKWTLPLYRTASSKIGCPLPEATHSSTNFRRISAADWTCVTAPTDLPAKRDIAAIVPVAVLSTPKVARRKRRHPCAVERGYLADCITLEGFGRCNA